MSAEYGCPTVVRKVFMRGWFSHGKAYHFVANKKAVQTKTFFCLVFPKSVRICGENIFFDGPHLLLGTDSRSTGRNQHRFAAKTFFLVFTYFWGQIPEILPKWAPILCYKLAIIWSLILVKMHVACNNFSSVNVVRNDFSPVNMARTSKKVGQAWRRKTK